MLLALIALLAIGYQQVSHNRLLLAIALALVTLIAVAVISYRVARKSSSQADDPRVAALETAVTDLERELKRALEGRRDYGRYRLHNHQPPEAFEKLEDELDKAKARIEKLEDELEEKRRVAAIGEVALTVFDINRGWITAAARWPDSMSGAERVTDFLRNHFRPRLAELYPHLKRAGVAIITLEEGMYWLEHDLDAPDVLAIVSPKRAELELEECLKKIGVPDYNLVPIPARRADEEGEDTLAVFAPALRDPTFEYLMASGAHILASARAS